MDKSTWNASTDSFNWLYHFQGGRQDPISGLVHFGTPGRDYSTTLGRWTEPDSGYIDGANVYQGEGSNPVANTDPKGAYIEGIASAVIGGFVAGIEQDLASLFVNLWDGWSGASDWIGGKFVASGGVAYESDGSGGGAVLAGPLGLQGMDSGLGGWGRYPGAGTGIHPAGAQPQDTLFAQPAFATRNWRPGDPPYGFRRTGNGGAGQPGHKIITPGDVAKAAWNLPNQCAGGLLAGTGLLSGGKAQNVNGITEVTDVWWMSGGLTIGDFTVYGGGLDPATQLPNGPARNHEYQHSIQSKILGPLYLPANLVGGTCGTLSKPRGPDPWHGPGNFMESGPQASPPKPFGK